MEEIKNKLFKLPIAIEAIRLVEHKKIEKAFSMAWEWGRADGEDNVKNYFEDLLDLLLTN